MRLEDFIKELKELPDERLHEERGVGDNFIIRLKADYGLLCDFLENTGHVSTDKEKSKYGTKVYYEQTGLVYMQVSEVEDCFFDSVYTDAHPKLKREVEGKYNCCIMFHPSREGNKKGVELKTDRAMTETIIKVGEYVLKNNLGAWIPSCYGPSVGCMEKGENWILSRMAFHPPVDF